MRINHNEGGPLAVGFDDLFPQEGYRSTRAHPPQHDAFRETGDGRGVRGRAIAIGQGLGHGRWAGADFILSGTIGAAEKIQKTLAQTPVRTMKRAKGDGNTFGAVLLLQGLEPYGNIVQGFVPADLLPGSLAPLPSALERPVDASLLVMQLGGPAALDTDKALTDRMCRIAADLGNAPVRHMGEHATLLGAATTYDGPDGCRLLGGKSHGERLSCKEYGIALVHLRPGVNEKVFQVGETTPENMSCQHGGKGRREKNDSEKGRAR